jgi:peptidoglycan-associated lipoprotein
MRAGLWLTLFTATVFLTGCPKKPAVQETPPPAAGTEQGETSGVPETPAERGTQEGELDAATRALLAQRVIYFDFDSYEIGAQYREIVAAHAKQLASHSNIKARLEGHTDERGSREYNIGLGERRAQAVRRALMLQGVGDTQLVTVSYGEERPAVAGNDETAWSKNRRVEIIYGPWSRSEIHPRP